MQKTKEGKKYMYCNNCGAKLEDNTKYCNKCGAYLGNRKKTRKNHAIIIIVTISIIALICVFITLLLIYNRKSRVYISNIDYNEGEITQKVENQNDKTNTKKENGTTAIIWDNVYTGVSIKNVDDANKLISEDSEKQKSQYSKEIAQVENELINKYGITAANLGEMDVDFAKELVNVFDKIYNEYPSVRGHLTNVSLRNTSMFTENGVIAAFMPVFNFATANSTTTYPWVIKTQILLSSRYFLNQERMKSSVTESAKAGHFPKNSNMYSPVAHEMGHYLSFLAMMNSYKLDSVLLVNSDNVGVFYRVYEDFGSGNYSLKLLNTAYERNKQNGNMNLSFDDWRGTISKYALAKDNNGDYIYDETIAEAFHDVYLNSESAAEASKYIVTVLKESLERRN